MLALLTNLPKAYLSAQLKDGLILMLLGVVVVFIFLTILICSIKVMSKIVGNKAPKEAKQKVSTGSPVVKNDDAKVAAAIAAAVDKGGK